ncbi:MAG: lactate utilization protein C [Alphaproteobacteria bacterium]
MNDRNAILNKIRGTLGDTDQAIKQRKDKAAGWKDRRMVVDLAPKLAAMENPIAAFKAQAQAVNASVHEMKAGESKAGESKAESPLANLMMKIIAANNPDYQENPPNIRISDDPALQQYRLEVADFAPLTPITGAPSPQDHIVITHAIAGIAETGSLVVASGKDRPILDHFYPQSEIFILEKDQLFITIEDFWEDFWQSYKNQNTQIPRVISLVTGPSRTGDVGQKIELGAHGPLMIDIIIT